MKFTILFFLTFIGFSLFAQLNQTDAKGRKQGAWQKTYPNNSALLYKGTFKDDKPVGTFEYYFPNGEKKAVITHGLPGGVSSVLLYFENGQLLSDGFYRAEKKDSLWYNYSAEGELISTENYKNDQLEGKSTYYYKEGQVYEHKLQIEHRAVYQNGVLNGKYQSYFYNGKLKSEGQYLKGDKSGEWIEYTSGGLLLVRSHYKLGQLHGWVQTYDKLGQPLRKTAYLNGVELTEKQTSAYLEQCKAKNKQPFQ